ncbi:MAG: ABC transporter substrate-binding protein [Bdellovibrionota bacterium]
MKKMSLMMLVMTYLASCTQNEQVNLHAAESKRTDKTLIYCSEGSPSGFNPQITEDATSINAENPYYNRLVTIQRGTTNVVADLASSWSISKDQKEYTFVLRKDVKFHTTANFKPTRNMNADDVLFSFNRQRLKDHPYHKVGGGNYLYFEAMEMDIIQDIQKVNDSTVKFFLKRPDSVFLANLTMEFASILSAEYADAMMKAKTPDKVDTMPVGTGPFVFKSYQKDSVIRYEANPEYYGAIKPQVERLVILITPDASVRTQKIKAGECHIIAEPSIADRKIFENDSNLKTYSMTGLNMTYLAFNTKKKPFDNLLVRKAIFHALNRGAYIDAIFHGMGELAESAVPPATWGFNNNLPTYEYDIQKSKQLLAKAGMPNGFSTEIWALPVTRPYNPDGRKMAEMMQADLAKVGIKVKIVTFDWPTFLAKSRNGEHSMLMFGWISDNGDPDSFLYTQLSCSGAEAGSNRAFWCFKPYNDIVEKAKRVSDIQQRTELYMDAQKIFKEQLPWVPLASAKAFRVTRKNVTGYVMDPLGRDFFDGVNYQ